MFQFGLTAWAQMSYIFISFPFGKNENVAGQPVSAVKLMMQSRVNLYSPPACSGLRGICKAAGMLPIRSPGSPSAGGIWGTVRHTAGNVPFGLCMIEKTVKAGGRILNSLFAGDIIFRLSACFPVERGSLK